ncbi:hypothetical protein HYZ76_02015 [Candidatus Falkowbacteria bacterium]|nr:hypothetical protein [Candidatus Falkowbacteria bacterium]
MPGQNRLEKTPKVEKIPEEARRKMMIALVSILMIIIFSFWLFSLKTALPTKKSLDKEQENDWLEVGQELNILIDESKDTFNNIKNQFNQLNELIATTTLKASPNTATPELSEEDIEKIKKNLKN